MSNNGWKYGGKKLRYKGSTHFSCNGVTFIHRVLPECNAHCTIQNVFFSLSLSFHRLCQPVNIRSLSRDQHANSPTLRVHVTHTGREQSCGRPRGKREGERKSYGTSITQVERREVAGQVKQKMYLPPST